MGVALALERSRKQSKLGLLFTNVGDAIRRLIQKGYEHAEAANRFG